MIFRRQRRPDSSGVELAVVVSRLRSELTSAMAAGQAEDLRFELGPVELELTVGVDREAGPSGKVKFWVLELGADAKRTSKTTQRIKLLLQPRLAGQAADHQPLIDGDRKPGER
jgi:NTP-dependent ternary system trypsin peptidase co-occuring protein